MEKRLRDLEEEALNKEAAYKAKYQNAELRRQEQMEAKQAKAIRAQKPYQAPANGGTRSSSVPAERKNFAGLAAVSEKEEEKKEIRPHASSLNEDSPQHDRPVPQREQLQVDQSSARAG